MNSKALIVGASLFAGTLSSIAAGAAHADTFITSGVSCVPLNPANFSLLQYSVNGVSNPSNVAVDVICPVAQKATPSFVLKFLHTFSVNNRAECKAFSIDDLGNQAVETPIFRLGGGPPFTLNSSDVIPQGATAVVLVQCKLPARFRTPDGTLQALVLAN